MLLLYPKKLKFKKHHRGRLCGKATRNINLVFGNFGLQALEATWITSKQIETMRRIISRYLKKLGKIFIRIFPDHSVTARAPESRMGSGKGSVKHWVAVVLPGVILIEVKGMHKNIAIKVLKLASFKLAIKTKILIKN